MQLRNIPLADLITSHSFKQKITVSLDTSQAQQVIIVFMYFFACFEKIVVVLLFRSRACA